MRAFQIAATMSLITLLMASPQAVAQSGPQKALTVVSWGGDYTRSQMLAYIKPYRKEIGEWVSMETYNGGLDQIREQVETANVVWDVVDFELADLIRGCREGLLEPIDTGDLPPGENGASAADDFIAGAFTDCGVGQTIWATVVAYDQESVGDAPPSQLADFFDVAKFPGKRGLRRDPRVIMEWALMADGVAPTEIYTTLDTEEGRTRAFGVLDQIKNHIVWWQSGQDPIDLLEQDAVVMTSVWNGRTYGPIVEDAKPIGLVWDGQIWDIDSWGIPKGTDNLDKALDFIRFATGSKPLAEQAKYISYGPARQSSMALISDEIKLHLPTAEANMMNALQTDAEWWATNHDALTEAFEAWLIEGGRGLPGTAR